MDRLETIRNFLSATERRLLQLESKKILSRAETFELDMCRADVLRAKKALSEPTPTKQPSED